MAFTRVAFIALLVIAVSESRPQTPADTQARQINPNTRFFGGNGPFGPGGFDFNNREHVSTAVAGAGVLGAGLFAVKNIAEGDDEIQLAPTIGGSIDPTTGQLVPELGLTAQVGNRGPASPTFQLGGQLTEGGIRPTVGAGANIGNGPLGANVNTGFVVGNNGRFTPKFGAGATVGRFSLGRPFGGRGFGRRR